MNLASETTRVLLIVERAAHGELEEDAWSAPLARGRVARTTFPRGQPAVSLGSSPVAMCGNFPVVELSKQLTRKEASGSNTVQGIRIVCQKYPILNGAGGGS